METEPQLIEQYVGTGKARLIYRHLLQLGATSQALAEASECAGTQGKFWEMRELIYRRQDDFGGMRMAEALRPLVSALDLDEQEFQQCLDSRQFRRQVEDDYAAARREGVLARPVMDINGTRIVGAQPLDVLKRALDASRP